MVSVNPGVQGAIRHIIFASKYKPEIVLGDALNNDIKIIKNEDKCLVYDRPITSVLTWKNVCDWYDDELKLLDTGVDIETFMGNSLLLPPEHLFFDTYLQVVKSRFSDIPVLLPQVWLYYDPKPEKE